MSFFSEVFSTNGSDSLPDWMRTGAEIVDSGLDLYDRISQGAGEPSMPPMQTQSAVPASPFGMTPLVMLVGAALAAYLFLGISRRR